MNENVILIGYRGTGKSSIGKKLAKMLNKEYISSDQEIEKFTQYSINDFIAQNNWDDFRKIESKICKKLSKLSNKIIDLGGGAIETQGNLENFSHLRNIVFWIDSPLNIIVERLKKGRNRPPLDLSNNNTWENETRIKLSQRLPLYKKYAHHQISNDKQLNHAVTKIAKLLEFVKK